MLHTLGPMFPPVLPSGVGRLRRLPALILIENANPYELAVAFLDLVRSFDVPVGTVVVLAIVSHLGRVGMVTYKGDVDRAFRWVREAYGKAVRVVNGYPVIGGDTWTKTPSRGSGRLSSGLQRWTSAAWAHSQTPLHTSLQHI